MRSPPSWCESPAMNRFVNKGFALTILTMSDHDNHCESSKIVPNVMSLPLYCVPRLLI